MRHEIHDFLPVDGDGRLSRTRILEEYGLLDWIDRPTLTVFGGSRFGNDPIYKQAAEEFSRLTQARGIGLVTGGAPDVKLGLMSTVADFNDNLIGVSPQPLADKNGIDSGISPRATNLITYDFYVRKVLMGLLSRASVGMPGGFGTIEELLEAEIYSARNGKMVHYLSVDGFWNNLLAGYQVLRDLGLIRSEGRERDIARHTLSPSAAIAVGHIDRQFREAGGVVTRRQSEPANLQLTMQSFLRKNPRFISDQVFNYAGRDAARVGVVVSGNISADSGQSWLHNSLLNTEFCEQSARLGREVAESGAVLVLSGSNKGLREIMAKSARAAGGNVIWIQKDSKLNVPLAASTYDGQMKLTVRREFEKATLFDCITQATGFLPGGIHTLDRVFEIVTREQTKFAGINSYKFMLGDIEGEPLKQMARPASRVIGYNLGGIWSDIVRQADVCDAKGFMSEGDRDLFSVIDTKESLGRELVTQAQRTTRASYDLLNEIDKLAPRDPGALRANTPITRAPQ